MHTNKVTQGQYNICQILVHCEATYATTTDAIELCNSSFDIQHQAKLNTLICNYESTLFYVSIEQRNPFMLWYISWPEFGLSEH